MRHAIVLTSSEVMLVLLIQGPHFGDHTLRTTSLENIFFFVEPQFILCKIISNVQIVVMVKYCKVFQTNAAAAAKSRQLCRTLSDAMNFSPPGPPVHGIFQAGVLEWVVIAFSETNASCDFNLKKRAGDCESGDSWIQVYHRLASHITSLGMFSHL